MQKTRMCPVRILKKNCQCKIEMLLKIKKFDIIIFHKYCFGFNEYF